MNKRVRRGGGGTVSDEHGLAYVLSTAALATGAKGKKAAAINLLLQDSRGREKRTAAKSALVKLGDHRGLDRVARSLHVSDRDQKSGGGDPFSRISYLQDGRRIRVAAITDTAVVPERHLSIDFDLVRQATARTTDPEPSDVAAMAGFLNSVLVPRDFRELLSLERPVILDVDRSLATVHWEFLASVADDPTPAALRIQMARQLRTEYSPPPLNPRRPGARRRALVIGDPGDPEASEDLPGAREETIMVAELLEEKGCEVVSLIGAPGAHGAGPISGIPAASRFEVLRLLLQEDFELLHYSGHGDFDPDDPTQVGWLFSDGLLTAGELEAVDRVPDLVFANACLSSRTSEGLARGEFVSEARTEVDLLPSLADEFLRRGVRNYVGTAWEVLDEGAIDFAMGFYETLLTPAQTSTELATIGEAMLQARRTLYDKLQAYGSLWAAYQHYGDPKWRLD